MAVFSCSFCGTGPREVARLVSEARVFICNECVALCKEIIAEGGTSRSGTMLRVRQLVAQVAPPGANVLIRGARGVGKSSLARTIHKVSARTGPLVTINCDVDEEQLEFDLFGHERWHREIPTEKIGTLVTAKGGTVFLKDVDKLPMAAQAKLLRAIEMKAVVALGGVSARPIDVRIIASTCEDLATARARRLFRADLLEELSAVAIEILDPAQAAANV
jgi:DNA-binding NtrC family response regulator